jgi:antitoxin HicB
MRRYTIILEADEDDAGYTVLVPALPGCVTQGDSIEQCIERAQEAITGYIESLQAAGEPVPKETQPLQTMTIEVAV